MSGQPLWVGGRSVLADGDRVVGAALGEVSSDVET